MSEQSLRSVPARASGRPGVAAGSVIASLRHPLWLLLPGVVFLGLFLVFPMAQLVGVSFAPRGHDAGPLDAYTQLLNSATYLRVMGTTFQIAAETTIVALLVAYPLAYWLSGIDARRRNMLVLLVLLPFWTSALVRNFVWLVLLGRTGMAVDILTLFGFSEDTRLLFSHGTVLFGMVHTMLPLAVLTMLPTMVGVDRRLPLAAATLGASPQHAFWRVFFPLSMPGVAAAGLLVMVISLGFFITPALLGSPHETLIGQVIITQILSFQNWAFAAALSTVLVAATLLVCIAYNWLFGITAISAGGGGGAPGNLLVHRAGTRVLRGIADLGARLFDRPAAARPGAGAAGRMVLGAYALVIVVALLLPIVLLLPMAFTTSKFLSFPPPLLSLQWFAAYFDSPIWIAATLRSFGIGLACAAITFLITFPGAYGIARARGRVANAAFLLFLAPMIIPAIAISLSLFYLFSQIGLVATDTGIIIGHVVLAIPTVFVITLATMKSYDWRLNDAAATLGANLLRTTFRITLPLMRGGLLAGLIFGFLISFEELTVVMFVGAGFKVTVPKQMWDDILLQLSPTLAAASVFVLLIVTVLFLAGEFLRQRRATGRK